MAMLERLTVRGIRNFGVDAEDEQKIIFKTPVTLILGQNGSGKTTIIECIKYALTGELPPNCKNGIGFINSPDVLHISESLGNVKLRLKNFRGVETTICRSAKVLKKNHKAQFKSLDATITLNENGKEMMVSKRNNDATDDMCISIGVSKAIINHVLFCHQEEANWPLGTDMELMTKFDQIFGTTEYNNALDKMRNMRKKYDATIKDKKITLKELEMIKQEADKKNMDINKYEDEKEQMQKRYDQCTVEIAPLQDEYRKVKETGDKLESITSSKTKVETELKNQLDNARKLSSKIKNIFAGGEAELQQEIDSFRTKKLQKQDELENNEVQLKKAEYDQSQSAKRVAECDRKLHLMMQDRQREQDLYSEKADYISKLCEDLKITVDFDIKNNNDRAAGLVVNIRTAMTKENDRIQEIKTNNDKEDAEQEKEIREHREKGVKIESEIDSVIKQLKESESMQGEQSQQLKLIQQSGKKLLDVRSKITEIKEMCKQRQKDFNSQGMREEIEQHRKEKTVVSDKLEEVDCQIGYSNTMASTLANFNTKKKHLEKQEAEVKRLKNKHFDNFQRFFPNETVESNFKRKIDAINQKFNLDSNRLDAKIRLKENHMSNFRSQIQSKKQDLKNLENELRQLEEEIDRVCEQTRFEDVLAATRENVDKWQMEHSSYKSSEVFYKKYIKKVEEMDEPCCPLCHKDLVGNEASHLTAELNEQIEMLPMNIERSGKLLREESIKLEKLFGLQASVERIQKLQSELIPKHKEIIKKFENDLSAAQEEVKKTRPELDEAKEKLGIAQAMIGDMSILDGAISDVEQTRKELQPLQQTLSTSDGQSDVNSEDLQKQRKELTDREKFLNKEIARKEKICAEKMDELHKLQQKEMELKQIELELQGNLQKSDGLKSRVNELDEQIKQLKAKKEASDRELVPIEAKIRHAEDKRRRTKASNAEKLNGASKQYDGLKKNYESIERVSNDLKKLAVKNLATEIERQNGTLNQLKEEHKKWVTLIESFHEKNKSLTKEIADQLNTERELQDNLELKKIQKQINRTEKELAQLRKDELEVDFDQISRKKAQLQVQIEDLVLEQARIKGQKEGNQKVINSLRSELNQPKYRDSVRNYKKAHFENVVLMKTVEDLTTYCETLEKALTKFHSDKMEKINSLIRDLWRSIYKGNDIEFIQINTEEVKGTTKRRSYTYRVVASKNDTFMDFRGQSSAGQRVLACLIIRIALAETFSGHCGVLALDEPTTNLDKTNIEALCEALNRIVEERESQNNFMLIVITHDEEFINAMGRINTYWRVFRDENGKSRTEKLRAN